MPATRDFCIHSSEQGALDSRGNRYGVPCHPKVSQIGPFVVPFCGSYLESYKVIPKRNYLGAYGTARIGLMTPCL